MGGASDGSVGVACMVLVRPHEPLRAFKTWFFFDDVIVALGSGISLPEDLADDHDVITTLTQVS